MWIVAAVVALAVLLIVMLNRPDRGRRGRRGFPGLDGTDGTSGTDGAVGPPGARGPTGAPGSGSQGVQGFGAQGLQGATGAQGSQGAGAQGTQGPQGITGTQGGQGAQGTGAQGAQGIQGGQGAQGIQGSGPQGDFGPQGIQGVQGVQGIQGSGPQGIQGGQGMQGVQGITGLQGGQGAQGATGETGIGIQGAQGVQGVPGITGMQGVQGGQGIQGIQGPQGPQGTTGETGGTGSFPLGPPEISSVGTNSLGALTFGVPFSVVFDDATVERVVIDPIAATGSNDVFTCPVGSKMWPINYAVTNGSTFSSMNFFPEFKSVGGTYSRIGPNGIAPISGRSTLQTVSFIFEAGEAFSVSANNASSGGASGNITAWFMVVPDTTPVSTFRVNPTTTGATLYTAVPGKVSYSYTTNNGTANSITIFFSNFTNAGVHIYGATYTPSGDNPSFIGNFLLSNNTATSGALGSVMLPGDVLTVNSNSSHPLQLIWVNIV